ncbi:hypothetical protein HHL16_05490 [Pseudoflavitalea sp. G-6-1-2]|uniref:hypothetical protein n=1 Tax=Pseudoflavitalea sp. G-6-1-2 TaxID=2728841 RepID=UPI00146F8A7E|nr:hypothetical protein [Pseudoflavitalea sp. G-6-1-2]NML20314.1 hypothetical protein [Pseudoflavitalea sp. G-6-1-2]
MKKLLWGLLIYANMGFTVADIRSGYPSSTNQLPVSDQSSNQQIIVYTPDACQVIMH